MNAAKSKQPARLITIHIIEHPRSVTRRIKACLTLAGAAAAGVLAMTATSPAAYADPSTAVLPDFPIETSSVSNTDLGVPLVFSGSSSTIYGSYTDLLGDHVVESVANQSLPLDQTEYLFPNATSPVLEFAGVTDPNPVISASPDGDVLGSDFSVIGFGSGLFNLYEDTPFSAASGSAITDNVNDVFAYFTQASDSASNIAFGIQYLDLPDAATPVDAINFLGSGGEILFSIPVTGDLLAGL